MMVAVVVEAAAWGAVAVVAAPVPLALPMILKSSFEPTKLKPRDLQSGIRDLGSFGFGGRGCRAYIRLNFRK